MAGVETAASDVIFPAQESATSIAVQHGKIVVNAHVIMNMYVLFRENIIILANISMGNLDCPFLV